MEFNLNGKKTYITGVALICWAVGGLVAGKVDINAAIQGVLIALTLMGVRHGLERKE